MTPYADQFVAFSDALRELQRATIELERCPNEFNRNNQHKAQVLVLQLFNTQLTKNQVREGN